MLGRIINEEFVKYDGKPVSIYIANPTEEQLKLLGYKTLVEENEPIYNEETQYIKERYLENGNNIVKSYEIVDIDRNEEMN